MSHSFSATPSHTLGRGSLGLSVDGHQPGRGRIRSPPLCAWPKATGSRLPVRMGRPRQHRLSVLGNFGVTCLLIHEARWVLGVMRIPHAGWWFWRQNQVPVGLL